MAYSFPRELASKAQRDHRLINESMGIKSGDSLLNAKGWKELVEGLPEQKAIFVANQCENFRSFVNESKSIDEASTAMSVGNFEKFGFPIIAMTSENLIAPDLVSTQTMQGPSSTIFYMDFVTSKARGGVPKGTSVWDARKGHHILGAHGSEEVPEESIGTSSVVGVLSGVLSRGNIRPGSVVIASENGTSVSDNGNGGIGGGSINYITGVITNVDNLGNTQKCTVTYATEIEGDERMGLDFQITSSLVHARELALSGRWTIEAAQAMKALHGQNAEAQLTAAIASELTFEIDRLIIADLQRIAGAGSVTWNANAAPSGVSFTEYKLTLLDALAEGSRMVHKATNRVRPNWVVGGLDFTAIVETLPMFVPEATKAEVDGVCKLGKLGRYTIYADPHMKNDQWLMGYKGEDWMRTGYVYAPWLLLYTTPTTILDDMVARKGFLTMFGNKVVNNKYYVKGTISGYEGAF